MELTSVSFGLFLFVAIIVYWISAVRWRGLILLTFGVLFYISWLPAYSWLLFLTIGITYSAARAIEQYPRHKLLILLISIGWVIGCLGLFKYFHFVAENLRIVGTELPSWQFLLPIGISFYSFQLIGYLVDIYQGKTKAEKNVVTFLNFVLFFPKLIAGPIERSTTLLPQLRHSLIYKPDNLVSGLQLMCLGLFKKVVIADNLRLVVDQSFNTLPEFKGLSLIILMMIYSWQLYADFSGYTDIARGIARMFGIELLENFNFPYASRSVTDFWRRWHISLSSWFRQYLYIPLGGSRQGLVRTVINLLLVFIICGLWHGAAWTFVIWGLLHGFALSLERLAKSLSKGRISVPKWLGQMYTYIFACATWVVFRAATLSEAWYIWRNSVIGITNSVKPSYIWATLQQLFETNQLEMIITLFCLASALLIEVLRDKNRGLRWLHHQPTLVRYAIYSVFVIVLVLLRNPDVTEFVYVQF